MRKTRKLMKEINELKWRDISCLWIRRFNSVKMSVLSNLIVTRFNEIPTKTQTNYFVDINKVILVYLERQQTQNCQLNVEGKQSRKSDTA